MKRLLNAFTDAVQRLTIVACAIMVVGLALLMLASVILRYYFDYSYSYTNVLLTGMLSWGVFLIIGSVARRHEHVGIGFFVALLLKEKAKPVQATIENIIALPFCIYLTWHSYSWVADTKDRGLLEFAGNDTYSAWIPIMVVPIGFAIAGLFYLERGVRQLHQLYVLLRQKQLDTPSDKEQYDQSNREGQAE